MPVAVFAKESWALVIVGVVDKTLILKGLCNNKLRIYIIGLSRGKSAKTSEYIKIREAMLAINFIDNYDLDSYLIEALLDFHIVNLNKL